MEPDQSSSGIPQVIGYAASVLLVFAGVDLLGGASSASERQLLGCLAIPAGVLVFVGLFHFGIISKANAYEPTEPEWRKIRPEGEHPTALRAWIEDEEERGEAEKRGRARNRLRTSWVIAVAVLVTTYAGFALSFSRIGFFFGLPVVCAYVVWSAYWGWLSIGSRHLGSWDSPHEPATTMLTLFSAAVFGIFGGGIEQYLHHVRLAASADADAE